MSNHTYIHGKVCKDDTAAVDLDCWFVHFVIIVFKNDFCLIDYKLNYIDNIYISIYNAEICRKNEIITLEYQYLKSR